MFFWTPKGNTRPLILSAERFGKRPWGKQPYNYVLLLVFVLVFVLVLLPVLVLVLVLVLVQVLALTIVLELGQDDIQWVIARCEMCNAQAPT